LEDGLAACEALHAQGPHTVVRALMPRLEVELLLLLLLLLSCKEVVALQACAGQKCFLHNTEEPAPGSSCKACYGTHRSGSSPWTTPFHSLP